MPEKGRFSKTANLRITALWCDSRRRQVGGYYDQVRSEATTKVNRFTFALRSWADRFGPASPIALCRLTARHRNAGRDRIANCQLYDSSHAGTRSGKDTLYLEICDLQEALEYLWIELGTTPRV